MSTVISGTQIRLWCLVRGSSSAFYVTIGRDNFIIDLKEVIKNKKQNEFANVDVDQLVLWRVNIDQSQIKTTSIDGILNEEDKLENSGLTVGETLLDVGGNNVRVVVGIPEQPGASASVENLANLFGQMNVSGSSASASPFTFFTELVKVVREDSKETQKVIKANTEVMIRLERNNRLTGDNFDTGSKTRAKAYQGIIFEKITNPEYFLGGSNIQLGNFANNGTVNFYLRDNPTPTDTEDNVQNWFNNLMLSLPSFVKRLVVVDTHNNPYLDGLKPDLSVFLEEDSRGGTCIPMFVQTLLEVKKKKSESGLADEDKGQLIDYMNVIIQHQPLREHFALFLSDGFRFYVMVYERNNRQYKEFITNFITGLRLFFILLRHDLSYTRMTDPRSIRFCTSPGTLTHISIYLKEFLGLGTSSRVYKVDYNNIQAALKYIKSGNADHEAQILRFLNNNNVQNIPNYIAHDNFSIIISPVCKRINRDQFRSYHALQLLHLLRNIHGINVFHRDVRPENILLDTDNDLLILADWGAAIRDPPNEQVPYEGTISFASPDILNNNLGFHQPKATDDLHSFVRSMYVLHNLLKMPTINPNEALASKAQIVREFWGDDNVNVKLDGVLWREMVNAANSGNYQILEKCCYIFKS